MALCLLVEHKNSIVDLHSAHKHQKMPRRVRYPAGKCPTFGVKKSAAAASGSAHIRRICIILLIDDARRMCQIGHISAIR